MAEPAPNDPAASRPRPDGGQAAGTGSAEHPARFAERHPWAVFILPYVVYAAVNMLEPTPEGSFELLGRTVTYASYPIIYTLKIALVMVTMAWLWPGYRQFAFKVSPLAVVVGAVGVVVWIALCKLQFEQATVDMLGLGDWFNMGQRSAFDPLAELADRPLLAYGFLVVRFWGLAVIVPVIEEFLLRGFVMRYFFQHDWWNVSFGRLSPAAIVAGTLVPILTHPTSELLAVVVWFSMVTWLMWRTRNMWDCVVAHGVTNFLLGAWVVFSGDWYLM